MEASSYRAVLNYRNYIAVHRELVKKIGPAKAIFLTEMIKKEDDLAQQGMLAPDGSFYFLLTDIQENTGFSYDQITAYSKALKDMKIMAFERRGQPPKNFYKIDYEELEKLLRPEVRQSPSPNSQDSEIGIPQEAEFVLNTDSQKNESQSEQYDLIRSTDAEASSSPSGSKKKGPELKEEMKQLFLEVLPAGEFTNRPIEEGKPVAKLYLEVQRFLTLLPDPKAFAHAYELDQEWLTKEKIDLNYFEGRAVEPLVRRAAKRFALMRKVGYEPEKKSALTKYIQDFFYNPQQKKSWFLFCCFHEPVEINRSNKDLADLADDDRAMILRHKPDAWSEKDFLLKAVKLLKWYRKVASDLQVYNYYMTDAVTPWQTRFSDFDTFLGVIDEYSKTWKEWTIGNFGLNNGTWDYFVKWCRDTFKVELDPSPTEVKEAMKAKEREDRRSKEREADRGEPDSEVAERQSQIREELLAELGENG